MFPETQGCILTEDDLKTSTEFNTESPKTLTAQNNSEEGIELTGYSLIFFQVVEEALATRKKEFLERLLSNFINSCSRILDYCPEMSEFDGSWRNKKQSTFLSIASMDQFVGDDFFNDMTRLFAEPHQGENLTVAQTEQVLGTFFISSLMRLYEEVILHSQFKIKLRTLAETLKQDPLKNPTETSKGTNYVRTIFKLTLSDWEQVKSEVLEQFKAIFQDLASKNNDVFVNLIALFFLKPFPFEIITNAQCILEHPDLIISGVAQLNLTSEASLTQSPSARKVREDVNHIKTAFEAIRSALGAIQNKEKMTIEAEEKIYTEFQTIIKPSVKIISDHHSSDNEEVDVLQQKKVVEKLNFIFHQYCLAVCSNFSHYIFKEASASDTIEEIIKSTSQTLKSDSVQAKLKTAHNLKEVVLASPPFHTIEIEPRNDKDRVFKINRLELFKNREAFAALLNANPLVKALLLSQVPITVILQILRVDNNFKDVSTVWVEPVLGAIGFACGVSALRNPTTVSTPVRILEALSASSVVLSTSLGIAILAHTTLFPEEGKPGGIDIDRFLKVVASFPIALSLLSFGYNSMSPHCKERFLSKRTRLASDFINHFTIFFGLNHIISIDIVKIMNKIERIDFSTQSSRMLLALLPAIPALFFAWARVAPIRACCRRGNGIYVNMSETINTAVLYGFTTALLTNLGIDLYGTNNNLPIEQTIFRGVFFPTLIVTSIAVMRYFAKDFRRMYAGNPEVIIQEVIKDRGLQSLGNGTFAHHTLQPLLDEAPPEELLINADEAQALREELTPSEGNNSQKLTLLTLYKAFRQRKEPSALDEPKRRSCCSCAIL